MESNDRALMHPSLSIAGTSAEAHIEARMRTVRELHSVLSSMVETLPHGRDYVGRSHVYSLDRAIYRERINLIIKLLSTLQHEALDIQARSKKTYTGEL